MPLNPAQLRSALQSIAAANDPAADLRIAIAVAEFIAGGQVGVLPVLPGPPHTLQTQLQLASRIIPGTPAGIAQAWLQGITQLVLASTVPSAIPPNLIPGPALGGVFTAVLGVSSTYGTPDSWSGPIAQAVDAAIRSCTALLNIGGVPTPFPVL